jgi:tetratricopeptide (TPR) repeat protein
MSFFILAIKKRGGKMDAKELFREGQGFFVEGKYGESIESFSKAIEAGEKSEMAFLSRGVAYFRMEQFDKAAQDFNIVIDINSGNFRAHFYRGITYMTREDYEKAIRDFDNTIKIKSDYGAAFFARGTAYAQMGNEYEAQRSIQSAVSCSEASMQWVTDHYGMFRTQFDQAMALMPGEGHFSEKRSEWTNNLKEYLEEDK